MAADLSRHDVFLDLQAFEHLAVEGADSVGCERNGTFGRRRGELVAGADDVVDLLRQVLLRLRQLQLALEVGQDLLLGQRVAFDRRRGERTLGEVEPMQPLGGRRLEGNGRDVLALRRCLTEQHPETWGHRPEVEREPEPPMTRFVGTRHVCVRVAANGFILIRLHGFRQRECQHERPGGSGRGLAGRTEPDAIATAEQKLADLTGCYQYPVGGRQQQRTSPGVVCRFSKGFRP